MKLAQTQMEFLNWNCIKDSKFAIQYSVWNENIVPRKFIFKKSGQPVV